MVGEQAGLARRQDSQLTGGDKAPGVTGAPLTTPRSGFFRQPQSSHVNKQMLVFYSLVHSGERGDIKKNFPSGCKEWRVNSCYTVCVFFCFFSWGWGVKRKKNSGWGACLCFGCRAASVCVCVCVVMFVRRYLNFDSLMVFFRVKAKINYFICTVNINLEWN